MAEEIEEEVELSLEDTIMAAMEATEVEEVAEDEIEVVDPTISTSAEALDAEANDVAPITPDEELVEGLVPHENWDDARTTAFNNLGENEEAKQIYMDSFKSLEKGFQKKFDGLATDHKEYEQIVGLMSPFEVELNSQGMSRYQGIQRLVGAQQMLQNNPTQGLSQLVQQFGGQQAKAIVQELAQQYGITEAANTESEAYIDPEMKALQDRLDASEAREQQNLNNAQATQQQEVNNQVTLFMEAKDDTGNLLHPHFNKVEPVMAALMNQGINEPLDKLYQRAVRQDPDLWQGIVDVERKAVSDTLGTVRKDEVSASKRASRNVKTNHIAPDTAIAEPDSVADSIRKAMQASAV